MRFVVHAAVVLLAVAASPTLAQRGPVLVIPGRPDVPIFENGVDISWSVVEGEFGLDRPGQVTPTVIYRLPPPVITTYLGAAANEPGYFPQDGKKPGYGRLEIVPGPNRRLPPPAQSYRRSWSSESAPTPADLPSNYPPTYVAPIIAPTINGPSGPWPPGRGPGAGPGAGPGVGHR
jgi:hypothetical protein